MKDWDEKEMAATEAVDQGQDGFFLDATGFTPYTIDVSTITFVPLDE